MGCVTISSDTNLVAGPSRGLCLRLGFLATHKWVHEFLKAQEIGNLVLFQLIFNVFLNLLFVLSYCIHEASSGSEMPISILVL